MIVSKNQERIFNRIYISIAFLLFLLGSVQSSHSLQSLSEESMREVSGKDGLISDINFPSGLQYSTLDYTDADGISGVSGTLQLGTVCFAQDATCGNSLNLSGLTVDADESISIGASDRPALVIGLPKMDSNSGLDVSNIYPGDPNGSPLGSLNVLLSSIQHTDIILATDGNQEGLYGRIDLDFHLDQFTFTDGDGDGTSGDLQVNNIHVDDGTGSPGNPATLDSYSLNADGDLFSGSGGMVVGMPSGRFSMQTGEVYTGDPLGTPMTSGVELNGLDLKNTSVEIGAN